MRIAAIVEWVNPVMEQVLARLAERGHAVEVLYPGRRLLDIATVRVEHDLYLLKSSRDPAMTLGGALHLLGAPLLNPYPAVELLHDKVIVSRVLQAAGVPTPDTYLVADAGDLLPLLEQGPLLFKPAAGSRGEGIRQLRTPEDLEHLPAGETVMVQRYQGPDGPDCKLFGIGDRVFGVRRPWPLQSYEQKRGEPFAPEPELAALALACRRAFGLELYGVDVVLSGGRPYVVDVNAFSGYVGVPDAPRHLADAIEEAGGRALRGEPIVTPARA